MIGYKTYNSLKRQWDYTDVSQATQTYTPTSSINLPLLQEVMGTKQRQYDRNSTNISNQIDYISSYFDYFKMYSKYPQVSHFNVEIVIVMKEYSDVLGKYSRADLGNNYIAQSYKNDLKYVIRKLDNIYEKVKHYERDPNYYKPNTANDNIITDIKQHSGTYTTTSVTDETYNPQTKKFDVNSHDTTVTKLHIDDKENKISYLKSTNNDWRFYIWRYDNSTNDFYELIDDTYDCVMQLGKNFDFIIFYENRVDGVFTKRYIYRNLTKVGTSSQRPY